jgi:hypothetical protein
MHLQEVDALLRVEMPTGRSNMVELSAPGSKTQGSFLAPLRTHSRGRGCVETPPPSNFGGRLTLGEVEKIAPSAIWRLAISPRAMQTAFSHSLGHHRPLVNVRFRATQFRPRPERAVFPRLALTTMTTGTSAERRACLAIL